jgi:hypothetical protein
VAWWLCCTTEHLFRSFVIHSSESKSDVRFGHVVDCWGTNLLNNLWIWILFLDQKSRIERYSKVLSYEPSATGVGKLPLGGASCKAIEFKSTTNDFSKRPREAHNLQRQWKQDDLRPTTDTTNLARSLHESHPISTLLPFRNSSQHRMWATKSSSIHFWVKYYLNFYTVLCLYI